MNGQGGLEGETVGQRIRRLREERRLSQLSLSGPGVSNAHISRIEAGTRQPSLEALRHIAHKLGVPVEYLEHGLDLTRREEFELALDDLELRIRLGSDTESVEHDAEALIRRAGREGELDLVAKARVALGMANAASGRLTEAIVELETACSHPLIRPELYPDVYASLVACYRRSGRFDEAVVVCEHTLAQTAPENAPLRMLLATHLSHALSDLGEFERAREVLEEHAGDFERSDPYAQARMHWSLARVAAMKDERRLALRHMSQAIALLRGSEDTIRLAGAHLVCAQILLWGGTTAGVPKHIRAARALLPADAEAGDQGTLRGLEALLAARQRRIRRPEDRRGGALDHAGIHARGRTGPLCQSACGGGGGRLRHLRRGVRPRPRARDPEQALAGGGADCPRPGGDVALGRPAQRIGTNSSRCRAIRERGEEAGEQPR